MVDVVLELTRITKAVSMVSTPQQQVSVIVDEISRCLDIDVCSLYRLDEKKNLVLLATHGLEASRPVIIPNQQGLVGLVVTSRHTINLDNGLTHPDYFHVADIKEERFKSFCGAPLVAHGEVIGVLVVQSRHSRKLSEKQEAFVTTLASHIALIVQQLPPSLNASNTKKKLLGQAASEGIAIGTPVYCAKATLNEVALETCDDIDAEIAQWEALREEVSQALIAEKQMLGNNLSTEITNMFEAYRMLLFDETMSDRIIDGIREGKSLATALKHAISHFAELFQKMEDAYLKARSEDVWHIGNKLYQTYIERDNRQQTIVQHDSENIVLIGETITVSDIAQIPVEHLKAIVCASGSRLSHTSIVANALGIPAVMSVSGLMECKAHDRIVVDGSEGKILIDPPPTLLIEFEKLIEKQREYNKSLDQYTHREAISTDGVKVELLANSGLLSDISPGLRHGAEGIGLFRTEIPFIVSDTFPTEEEQIEIYANVFRHYQGKPVYMRTLDIGADKQLPYFPITGEENPAMGWRGIRFTLDNVQLLMTQLRAMLRAAGENGDLKIIVPMVGSMVELTRFHQVLDDAVLQLNDEGHHYQKPEVGIMLEVPAAISQLPFWKDYVDFISIGSNDLSQYLLAIDRDNPRVSDQFDHAHPAVLAEIKRSVDTAQKLDLPVCVCGEMASDPASVLLLFGMGVRKLSVSSSKIPKLKALISKVDSQQAEALVEDVLKLNCAQLIRERAKVLLDSLD